MKSKQDLYNKYKKQGYSAQDAKKLASYEIVHGENNAKKYAANNVKKSGSDYTATSPRDNVNTDWRTQERLNAEQDHLRHYDFKYHTKYEKVTDYVKGGKNKVKGDRYMYSIKNNSNGNLVVSTRPINKNSFINTLNYYSGQNKNITILSGTHGSPDGYCALSNKSMAETIFFNEDVVTSISYNNVRVYDVAQMSKSEFNQHINSNNVVICAWCFSERSQEIIEAIKKKP